MIRITSGRFKGRVLKTPSGDSTRPTQARLRQALLNSLQAEVPGARVLDLFAGSGALAFEALSRGAESALLVEKSRNVAALIEKNAAELGCRAAVHVLAADVDAARETVVSRGPFDLIFVDPPYEGGWELKLLEGWPWERLLQPGGSLCLEWGTQKSKVDLLPDSVGFLVKTREKTYGDSVLTTYQRLPENSQVGFAEGARSEDQREESEES